VPFAIAANLIAYLWSRPALWLVAVAVLVPAVVLLLRRARDSEPIRFVVDDDGITYHNGGISLHGSWTTLKTALWDGAYFLHFETVAMAVPTDPADEDLDRALRRHFEDAGVAVTPARKALLLRAAPGWVALALFVLTYQLLS